MVLGQHLKRHNNDGFSLLELIIVLVIIGVIVATMSLTITDTRNDKLRLEARRLSARLSLARDESIITNQELGLEVEPNGYRFLALGDEGWIAIDSIEERQLIAQELPEGMEIQLQVEGLFAQFQEHNEFNSLFKDFDESTADLSSNEDEENKLRPQIYLMTSGELNAFKLAIGYEDESPIYYLLEGSIEGNIKLLGPFRESLRFAMNSPK